MLRKILFGTFLSIDVNEHVKPLSSENEDMKMRNSTAQFWQTIQSNRISMHPSRLESSKCNLYAKKIAIQIYFMTGNFHFFHFSWKIFPLSSLLDLLHRLIHKVVERLWSDKWVWIYHTKQYVKVKRGKFMENYGQLWPSSQQHIDSKPRMNQSLC